ncbi:MAG: DUF547 domain-containing protein [Pseudomonadota bacterium]|nr:DUF547 domain-containing protein [Pseudomonadota bacterium]
MSVAAGAVFGQDVVGDADARWSRVLDRYVNDQGQVDFRGLAGDPANLNAYVDYIARVSPVSAPQSFPTREARLAYYINAYNALAMFNVVRMGIPESLTGLTKLRFFWLSQFQVGGESMSLYSLENRTIRPMGDERVHFALNCMSVGCPRLPREPFAAARLDEQLDREARRFFGEARNLQIDSKHDIARVSEILRFYTEDFLRKSPSLIAYIDRYAAGKVPGDYAVTFIEYDWTLNAQRRPR